MSTINNTLQSLGIDAKQAQVYLACLELGSGTIAEVAKKSGIKRTSIYNFLDEMKQKGLVSEITEKGKTILVAEDPNNLVTKTHRQYETMKSALPELMGIFNLPGNKPKVKFYQGEEGVLAVYNEMLKTGETVYGFSDYEKMFESVKNVNLWVVPTARVKKKIKFYNIAKNGPRGREIKLHDYEQLRETKLVDKVDFETDINIFGNKVGMISFRQPLACVVVEDSAIAQTLRSVWKAWWATLK